MQCLTGQCVSNQPWAGLDSWSKYDVVCVARDDHCIFLSARYTILPNSSSRPHLFSFFKILAKKKEDLNFGPSYRHRPGKRREDTACVVPTAPGEFGAEGDCVTGDAGVCKHAH